MLNTKNILYALDDVCIIPAPVSDIKSRSECNPYHINKKLPIFTAPMTAIVSENNLDVWNKNDIIPILPRNINIETRVAYATNGTWAAFSIGEFQEYFVKNADKLNLQGPVRVLIDIANGHMKCLLQMIPESKVLMRFNHGDNVDYQIMAGNIANPETYRNLALAGCDYVRCSIGSGQCCLTAGNANIMYPLASLLSECYALKCKYDLDAKIIADGGINSYNRAITALALGADYVMIGTTFASCFESCAPFIFNHLYSSNLKDEEKPQAYMFSYDCINDEIPQYIHELRSDGTVAIKNRNNKDLERIITPNEDMKKHIINDFEISEKNQLWCIRKEIFGMSTRKAQTLINDAGTKKTSEGITRKVPVKYTVAQWVDNFKSYLKSAMSYCNKTELDAFIGEVETAILSPMAKNSFNK